MEGFSVGQRVIKIYQVERNWNDKHSILVGWCIIDSDTRGIKTQIFEFRNINILKMGNCFMCAKPRDSQNNPKMVKMITSSSVGLKSSKQLNKKSIIIKTNPENMKLMGVPKSWLSKKYCNKQIIDQTNVVSDDLSDEQQIEQIPEARDLTISSMTKSDVQNYDHKRNSKVQHMEDYQRSSKIRDSDIVVSIQGSMRSPNLSKSKSQLQINQMVAKLQVDIQSKYGIKNLPEDWAFRMEASGLADDDVKEHPEIMMDLIKNESMMELDASKSSVGEQKLISYEEFIQVVHQVEVIYYNPVKEYQFKKKLGSGAMCQVFHAKKKGFSSSEQCAVRIMKGRKPQDLPKIQQQIAIMKLCQSDNIVKHIQTYFFNGTIYMFIEYMDAGSLTGFIEKYHKKTIPEKAIAFILRQIIKGVAVLHRKKRIHRDLKSDNILLSKNGEIKIADFGFAAQLTQEKQKRNTLVGTPSWMAPELIRKNNYTEKVDIWSIGVIILELINGEPPYLRLPPLKAMYQITSKNIPSIENSSYSSQLKEFYLRCMVKQPQQRADCKQLLSHPFLNKVDNKHKQCFKECMKQIQKF